MNPNLYVAEELARQKEEEIQRRMKYAWQRPRRHRPALGQRLWSLVVMGSVVTCGLLWILP
jgi:hypothetical protein